MSIDKVQEFSDGLVAVLGELTALREENAKLRERITSLEHEKTEYKHRVGECITALSSSLDDVDKPSSVESSRETVLECFKKKVVASQTDYAMIEEILRVNCGGVPTLIVGRVVAEAIIGKCCAYSPINIFTFDESSVVDILNKYGFVKNGYGTYSSDKGGKRNHFVVYPFKCIQPNYATLFAHMKNTFNKDSWACYDGTNFEHFDLDTLQKYTAIYLNLKEKPSIGSCSFDSNRLVLKGDRLTLQAQLKQ